MGGEKKNLHDGHRERLKKRFVEDGLDSFSEHEVLELLLYYAIPRKDVNELAHRLIDRFGRLDVVFDAQLEALLEVEGVGLNTALLIKLMPQLNRRYQLSGITAKNCVLDTAEAAGKFFVSQFYAMKEETVYMACLDAKCRLLANDRIAESISGAVSGIELRDIVEKAIMNRAHSVVIAHNHPDGFAVPSTDDIKATRRITEALAAVEIKLADHIIISGGEFMSVCECCNSL